MYEAIALAALELGDNILDLFPDYEQAKRQRWHTLKTEFHDERKKPYGLRNDRRMLDLSDELVRYVSSFSPLLQQSGVASVRKS